MANRPPVASAPTLMRISAPRKEIACRVSGVRIAATMLAWFW
jgi:hypothetical protein